jgi:hypothetical protein
MVEVIVTILSGGLKPLVAVITVSKVFVTTIYWVSATEMVSLSPADTDVVSVTVDSVFLTAKRQFQVRLKIFLLDVHTQVAGPPWIPEKE